MELTSEQISARNLIQKHLGVSRAYATELLHELPAGAEREILDAHAALVERGLEREVGAWLRHGIDQVRGNRREAAAADAQAAVASALPEPEFAKRPANAEPLAANGTEVFPGNEPSAATATTVAADETPPIDEQSPPPGSETPIADPELPA